MRLEQRDERRSEAEAGMWKETWVEERREGKKERKKGNGTHKDGKRNRKKSGRERERE